MKSSNRERQPATSGYQNRLNKTQQPMPPKSEYLDNSHQSKKINMTEKSIASEKQAFTVPPRSGSSQKIIYKVEENMTTSKIQEAKHGLQLLKKKMSRNGMSRQKNERASIQRKEEENMNKKVTVRQEQSYGYEKEIKKPPSQIVQKKPSQEVITKKSPPIPSKSVQIDDRPVRKQLPKEQFINPNEEIPLNSNQDFMAILERQMAKENAIQSKQGAKGPKKPVSYQQEEEQIQLVQCSKGCGRQFNVNIIQKHQKVCQKVFQSKRKVFNSAAHRQLETQGFKQPPPPPPPPIKEEKLKSIKAPKQKQGKVPKWKLQSAAFRAGIKQGRGQELSEEQKVISQQANGMVQCGTCGRKFNEEAAKRHIPFCESKAKQMPKMNTSKRK